MAQLFMCFKAAAGADDDCVTECTARPGPGGGACCSTSWKGGAGTLIPVVSSGRIPNIVCVVQFSVAVYNNFLDPPSTPLHTLLLPPHNLSSLPTDCLRLCPSQGGSTHLNAGLINRTGERADPAFRLP